MNEDERQVIRDAILREGVLVRAVFSGSRKGQELAWKRVTARPVQLKDGVYLQVSYFDAFKDITKNFKGEEAEARLEELLDLPFKNITVDTRGETLHFQWSKKDRLVVHREKAAAAPAEPELSHDREKKKILLPEKAAPFLQAVGILAQDGKIKADMQRKFRQINEFLRVLAETEAFSENLGRPLRIIDFGCGNAYLTFATYYYFNDLLGLPAVVTGVDIKADLLENHRLKARALGWEGLTFAEGRISDYQPDSPPDGIIALHACDTATDDALAQGIRAGSRLIVTAPCCQHDLQAQLAKAPMPPPMLAVSRDGILNERLGDILTDTFRATLLRVMGYHTDVIQFVSSEHTAKNLLIRSVKTSTGPNLQAIEDYRALKAFWGVTPYLEKLVKFTPHPPTPSPTRGEGE